MHRAIVEPHLAILEHFSIAATSLIMMVANMQLNSWFATQGVPKNEFSCGNQIWKRVWNWSTQHETLQGRLCWVVQFQNRPLLKMVSS
jgi:hypothetical protein